MRLHEQRFSSSAIITTTVPHPITTPAPATSHHPSPIIQFPFGHHDTSSSAISSHAFPPTSITKHLQSINFHSNPLPTAAASPKSARSRPFLKCIILFRLHRDHYDPLIIKPHSVCEHRPDDVFGRFKRPVFGFGKGRIWQGVTEGVVSLE